MGESSDSPPADRIRSFAREQALDRSLSSRQETPATLRRLYTPPQVDAPKHTKSAPVDSRHDPEKPASGLRTGVPLQNIHDDHSSITQSASPQDTKEQGEDVAALTTEPKPGWGPRMKAGSVRFIRHTKNALFRSWINILLICVPIGIAINWVPMDPETHATLVFSLNAISVIPLAGLLSHATESVASKMGDTWASLLNVTFGNAVELIIFIIALAKNEIAIVQASILGSILANLLLILGMSFLLGGLRYREQLYNSTVTQMSACLLSLAVSSLLLPTAFHATFEDSGLADIVTTKISRGTSVILLLVYVLYLLFQLKSHAYMYESTPQRIIDEESHPGVLADMMNSSSSSDSSSSSSSDDSTDSSGSHKKRHRMKKMFKHRLRRKSSASTLQTNSVLSSYGSPTDKRSIAEENLEPGQESYFELSERQRRETQSGGASGQALGNVMSGDEADDDGEIGAPRIRDFSVEQSSSKPSPPGYSDLKGKSKEKKHHKRKHDHDKHSSPEKLNSNAKTTLNIAQDKGVNFAPEPDVKTIPAASPLKPRPFAARQLSRVVPPLPPVFIGAPRPSFGARASQGHPMAMARSGLRRTNSLPDRFNQQTQQTSQPSGRGSVTAQIEPLQRTGTPAINEPDALRKHREEEHEEPMSRTAAIVLLLISTGLVAVCAELLVDAIPVMIESTSVSQAFIGLIILPIVGNAAEHVTAVTVAMKNKMDLAIGVAVGSSIQIALFVTPFIVLLGWCMGKEMSLYFNLFDTVSLFVTAFVINFLILDGRSNYLEGALLIAAYIIIAVAAFFYPSADQQSSYGGAGAD